MFFILNTKKKIIDFNLKISQNNYHFSPIINQANNYKFPTFIPNR
jgi:hypothetical protein